MNIQGKIEKAVLALSEAEDKHFILTGHTKFGKLTSDVTIDGVMMTFLRECLECKELKRRLNLK